MPADIDRQNPASARSDAGVLADDNHWAFPPVVIQHAVWVYLRFTLSYRDVEDLLAERGLDISYEGTVNLSRRVRWICVSGNGNKRFIANRHCRFQLRSGISGF